MSPESCPVGILRSSAWPSLHPLYEDTLLRKLKKRATEKRGMASIDLYEHTSGKERFGRWDAGR